MSSLGNLDKAETECSVSLRNGTASNKETKAAANNANLVESTKDTTETTDKNSITTVFQFKIILKKTKPTIWRRIQVPKDYNFKQFHEAILRAMGWYGRYAHMFSFPEPDGGRSNITIGPYTDYSGCETEDDLDGEGEKLSDYFPAEKIVHYEYDFREGWMHKILFEGEMPEKEGEEYPKCIDGRRACPPGDCGGVDGYKELCEIMQNPQHEEYGETTSWLKESTYIRVNEFDPAKFDPKSVTFKGPRKDPTKVGLSSVFQFKIILRNTKPPIWRRIQVPKDYNFKLFHEAILRAMGWRGRHLHEFRFPGPPGGRYDIVIGPDIDDSDWEMEEDRDEEEFEKLSYHFPAEKAVEYEYDFGDRWKHEILFEGEMPEKEGEEYPKCIDGRRACPPDACGGIDGYKDLCKIMQNPQHEEYGETKTWLEDIMDIKEFDPARFDPKSVMFW